MKPGIKIKILSESEADKENNGSLTTNQTYHELNKTADFPLNENEIKIIRNNNVLINRLKKHIDMRNKIDEFYKEIEKKNYLKFMNINQDRGQNKLRFNDTKRNLETYKYIDTSTNKNIIINQNFSIEDKVKDIYRIENESKTKKNVFLPQIIRYDKNKKENWMKN